MLDLNIVVDFSKVTVNDDGSVIVGSDEPTYWDKQFGHTKPVIINGDFLLKLLTEKGTIAV